MKNTKNKFFVSENIGKRHKIFSDKKAATSISILLLVIMTLVLTGTALFAFVVETTKIDKDILGVGVVEGVYAKQEQIKFLLNQILKEVNDKNDFEQKIINLNINEPVFNELRDIISQGKHEIKFTKNKINLEIKDFEIRALEKNIGIIYKTNILIEVEN
ncbi:MAG: hypothetical protein KJ559_02745 [Nanoarchaeota archaeon]|nr:hypothetical protein [Nanoarchaeota archaeon]